MHFQAGLSETRVLVGSKSLRNLDMTSAPRFATALGLFLTLGFTTGCQGLIASFLQMKRPIQQAIPFEGSSAIKVSPGNSSGQSGDVTVKAHITITNRLITGSDVAARVSISSSPKN